MVPGRALVEGERLVLVGEPLLRVRGEHAVRAGARAVERGRPVVRERGVLRLDRVDLLDHAVGDLVRREPVAARRLGPLQRAGHGLDDLRRRGEPQRRVGPQPSRVDGTSRGAEHPAAELAPLLVEPGERVEAELVDLLGRQVGRGVPAQRRGVELLPAVDPGQPGLVVRAGDRRELVAEDAGQPLQGRPDGRRRDLGDAGAGRRVVDVRRQRAGLPDVGVRRPGQVPGELVEGLPHAHRGRAPAVGGGLPVAGRRPRRRTARARRAGAGSPRRPRRPAAARSAPP